MNRIDETALRNFEHAIPRENAHFTNRNFISVVKTADCDDGDQYAGLIRTREGFLRIALDEANNALILFASKVADNLRGNFDGNGDIRPTELLTRKSYCIAARRVRSGALLPPDIAGYFVRKAMDYSVEIGQSSLSKFTFYSVRIENSEIYANKHAAYVIERDAAEKYSLRLVIPATPNQASNIPAAIKSRWDHPLYHKYLVKGVDRATAHHEFALHNQSLSSRLWDHQDIYKNEGLGLRAGKFLTDLAHYPASHLLEMGTTALVAAGFAYFHEPTLGVAIAGLAASHAVADIGLKASFTRAAEKISNWKYRNAHTSLDSYDVDEDCAFHYLLQNTENLAKPGHHVDPRKINIGNLRFLTFNEMQPVVGKIKLPPEDMLKPASLRGLSVYGGQRGFSARVCFPAPKVKMEITQGGLLVLKRAISPIVTDMFVTYREDACVSENTRLPQAYIDQANRGSGIQYIIHNKNPAHNESRFSDRPVDFDEMKKMLTNLFHQVASTDDNFTPHIAPGFQADSFRYIHELFEPGQPAIAEGFFMGGRNPLLPTIKSIL